jgi:cholesterol transport system auxiliary component
MTPRRLLLATGAALLGAACSNPLSQPYPEKRLFLLEARRPGTPQPGRRGRVVLVRDVQAVPGTESRSLQTRLPDGQSRSDFWNEFFAPPAAMVDDALRRWLAESGAASAVLAPGSRARADIAIEATLTALYGDATTPGAPRARIGISALFLGLDRDPPRILGQVTMEESAPLASLDPPVLAAGLNTALAGALGQMEAALRRLAL